MEVTPSQVHDSRLLPTLLDQIPGCIVQVSGDGAYDTRACYQSILDRDAVATIPPRRNARPSESCGLARLACNARCPSTSNKENRSISMAHLQWLHPAKPRRECNVEVQDVVWA